MVDWTWVGPKKDGSTDWFETSNWAPLGGEPYPQPGDTVTIESTDFRGPTLSPSDPNGGKLDDLDVALLSGALTTSGTEFGPDLTLAAGGAGSATTFRLSGGAVTYAGTITVTSPLTVAVEQSTLSSSDFTLAASGLIDISSRQSLLARLGQSGTFYNDGTIEVGQGASVSFRQGALEGSGTIDLGTAASAYIVGTVGSSQTIALTGSNEILTIGDADQFFGAITGYKAGDVLALDGLVANHASYDAATSTVTLSKDGAVQATLGLAVAGTAPTLRVVQGRFGVLLTASDASLTWVGGTGNWLDAANWDVSSGESAGPQPGDKVTIGGGTATLSAAEAASYPLEAIKISLASTDPATPAVLQTDDALFGPDTVIRNGAEYFNGTLVALGSTIFNGSMLATSRGGALTLDIGSDGVSNTFLVGEDSGSLIATQKGTLNIMGAGTLDDEGIILAQGSINIGAGVTVTGAAGLIQIQAGGSVTVGGSINQNVSFSDNVGWLTLDDLSGFQAPYDTIFNFQQGNAIDLPGVAANGFSYDGANDLLTLQADGQSVGSLSITTLDGESNFNVATDGHGGSLVTYRQPNPTLQPGLPVAIVAAPGQTVSLRSILTTAFGSVPVAYATYGLSYMGQQALSGYDWSYWDPSNPSVSAWSVGGTALQPLPIYPNTPPFSPTESVSAGNLDSIGYVAGNNIGPETYLQVPIAGNGSLTTQNAYFSLVTIDPAVASPTIDSGRVDPADIVASALRFAAYYEDSPNDNDCGFIANAVGAAAGATMSYQVYSTDPNANVSGGFWRVVYRGIDQVNPVANWSTLVQPGDVVRMGWKDGGQHTTTILGKNADGSVIVYDNADVALDADTSTIGIHSVSYWDDTRPDSITIYRLDPLHQYLTIGGPQAEFIQGSVYNNLIQPGGGADTITAGAGNNEIQGSFAQLNGTTATDFHIGDTLDVTDLDASTAATSYDAATGVLTISDDTRFGALQLPTTFAGQPFFVTPDGNGGSVIGLAPADLTQYSMMARNLLTAQFTPLAAAGRTTNVAVLTDGSNPPSLISGESNYAYVASPTPGRALTLPAGYAGLFAGGSSDVSLFDTSASYAVLVGNSGDDTLRGGAGDVVVANGGNNLMTTGSGGVLIGGSGTDTLFGGGPSSILMGGTRGSLIADTQGHSAVIDGPGADTVLAAVSDTIAASGTVLAGLASDNAFLNGTGISTVIGGAGSGETIDGGAGGGLFSGGAAGGNLIVAGQGAATIFGGGDGDVLFAGGAAADVIVAGPGNETLSGAGSTGDNVLFGGSGADLIGGGGGRETFVAGSGGGTLVSGTGEDTFAFLDEYSSGGLDQVVGFDPSKGDKVLLSGYGPEAVHSALATAVTQGGTTMITLPDRTMISFLGVSNLQASNFL